MQEEVKDNKRFKISNRSVSASELFNNPTLNPTVGAGGQYRVNVQQQPKTSWEKLAEGLGSMMGAANAIQKSDVAAGELAEQQVADASLEELAAMKQEAAELEDGMYKANGFIDRLTRTGKASIIENPLTFSRAQAAYGARIAQEDYQGELSKRLAEAKMAAKKDPNVTYNPISIQTSLSDEINEKYGLDKGGSATNSFNRSVAAFNKNTLAREFDDATKIADAHQTIGAAPVFKDYTRIISDKNSTQEQKSEALNKINQATAGLGLSSVNKSLMMYGQEQISDGDYVGLHKFIKEAKDSTNVLGGYPLGSPAYAETLNRLEYMADKASEDESNKGSVSNAKVEAKFRQVSNIIVDQKDNDIFEMKEDYGIKGLKEASSYEEAQQIVNSFFRSKAKAGGFPARIDSAIVDVENNIENVAERELEKLEIEARQEVNKTLNGNQENNVTNVALKNAKDEAPNNAQLLEIETIEGKHRSKLLEIQEAVGRNEYPKGSTEDVIDGEVVTYKELDYKQKNTAINEAINAVGLSTQEELGAVRKEGELKEKELAEIKDSKISKEDKDGTFRSTYEGVEISDHIRRNAGMTENDMYNVAKLINKDPSTESYFRNGKPKEESLNIIRQLRNGINNKQIVSNRPLTLRSGRVVTPSTIADVDEDESKRLLRIANAINENTVVSLDEIPLTSDGYMPSRIFNLSENNVRDLTYDKNIPDKVLLERLRIIDSSLSLADIKLMKNTK